MPDNALNLPEAQAEQVLPITSYPAKHEQNGEPAGAKEPDPQLMQEADPCDEKEFALHSIQEVFPIDALNLPAVQATQAPLYGSYPAIQEHDDPIPLGTALEPHKEHVVAAGSK